MPRVKYSSLFTHLADIIIVDNVIVKDRIRSKVGLTLVPHSIESIKTTYPIVLVQSGDKIDIYCNQKSASIFIKERLRLSKAGLTKVLKNVTIHVEGEII